MFSLKDTPDLKLTPVPRINAGCVSFKFNYVYLEFI